HADFGVCYSNRRENSLMHDVAKGISTVPVQSNARPRRRGRAVGIALGLLAAILVFAFGIKFLQIRKMMSTPMVMPPTTVSSVTVKEEDWAPTLSAVGSISAVQGAVVSAELSGVVSQIAFENGGTAKKGDLLVQLDASAEEALLRSAEAEAELARQDLERTRGLASQKVLSMVDSSTRNITLQATLENPDHVLRPGMFAKAEVTLPEKHKALVVPGSAISYAPFGDSVFVIEKKKDEKTGKESQAIRQQFVRV